MPRFARSIHGVTPALDRGVSSRLARLCEPVAVTRAAGVGRPPKRDRIYLQTKKGSTTMGYSIVKTNTTKVSYGENDPRNYNSVSHEIMAGGKSQDDARAEAMRTAAHSVEAILPDRPAAVVLVWRSSTQLDLQVAWEVSKQPVTCETYVICWQDR